MIASCTDLLVCPRDHLPLLTRASELRCANGHRFPIVADVPILLLKDVPPTLHVAAASLAAAEKGAERGEQIFLDTLGISAEEKHELAKQLEQPTGKVDPVVAYLVGATNGIAYKHLVGKLNEYPIPEIPLPPGDGRRLLDVGCNWGRWCLAAARKGYEVWGIEPSLGAVLAARRVARQLGLKINVVVGDARYLPFRPGTFDVTFSYSVLQHFSRQDAAAAVEEMGRVLKTGGRCQVQMPNILGVRCLYHQWRRGFEEATEFDVRYWHLRTLRELFTSRVGPTTFAVDCFFGLGLQPADRRLMPLTHRAAITVSELLRQCSKVFDLLTGLADSLYVQAVKQRKLASTPRRPRFDERRA